MPATTLDAERVVQARWRLLPRHAGLKLFDHLVDNEFRSPAEQQAAMNQRLAQLVRYAVAAVPYWRELFGRLGLAAGDVQRIEELPRLPLIGKRAVYERFSELRSTALPAGERVWGPTHSSGTTGRPTRVIHSVASNAMFSYLTQRHLRWFRFEPMASFAVIRLASQLPPGSNGRPIADGETLRMARWRYAGQFFATGPYIGFAVTNPIERQIEWLQREQPAYLMSYSESLEHLALAWPPDGPGLDHLRGLQAISEQLTPDMRRRIERCFGAPVEQVYGLNEIGLVAVRCAAGRYHVHTEHCLVEIVDEAAQPVPPGRRGRIVITTLNNLAMPLLRYDTDDLADAVGGPCPCGRTLPAFGEPAGRYSRIAFLPDGTLAHVGAVRAALETMPAPALRNLRQFQLHQFRDGSFELRLVVAGALPPAFAAHVAAAWQRSVGARELPLRLVTVDAIARSPGGKLLDFTSDLMPAPDRATTGQ
jgi:phenylacetate-CoA ligase